MAEQYSLLSSSVPLVPVRRNSSGGEGSSADTILNIVNIAFGAGMLGLPYAIQGSGFCTGILGIGAVLAWNFVCCWKLVAIRNAIVTAKTNSSQGTNAGDVGTKVTFAMIGDFAMGQLGSNLVYLSVIVTLLGASSAYFITANDLLQQTRLYFKTDTMSEDAAMYVNTFIYMVLMYPVTCIESLAPLSKASGPAILALVAGFAVIIKLGIDAYGFPAADEILSWNALYVPTAFQGFSSFFGVAVFSYGATLIIIEIQESMADTNKFVGALKTSMWIIWTSYSILGGLALLIYQQAGPVSDNIMKDLKGGGAAQEPLRIFIVCATLLTYPLAMQPVSTVFGRALIRMGYGVDTSNRRGEYGTFHQEVISSSAEMTSASTRNRDVEGGEAIMSQQQLPPSLYYGLRLALVTLTGLCATSVPNFGVVVSLLGSFAVTLGSFVLPPLFHMLVFKGKQTSTEEVTDMGLFILGVVTCVFCTTTTALGVLNGDY